MSGHDICRCGDLRCDHRPHCLVCDQHEAGELCNRFLLRVSTYHRPIPEPSQFS
jgi:hypothetical protein